MLIKAGDIKTLTTWWQKQGCNLAAQITCEYLKNYPNAQEDVMQDTFIKLFRKIQGVSLENKAPDTIENAPGYTTIVVRTTCLHWLEKNTREILDTQIEDNHEISEPREHHTHSPSRDNLEQVIEDFRIHLAENTASVAQLLLVTQDDNFLLWYLKRVKNKTLEELRQLDLRNVSNISEVIRTFERKGLMEIMARWSYQRIVDTLEALCEEYTPYVKNTLGSSVLPEEIGQFLLTPVGEFLYKRLYGEHLQPRKRSDQKHQSLHHEWQPMIEFLRKRPSFTRNAGTLFWLAHYTRPDCTWDTLEETWGIDATALKNLAAIAYPPILEEYVLYQDFLKKHTENTP